MWKKFEISKKIYRYFKVSKSFYVNSANFSNVKLSLYFHGTVITESINSSLVFLYYHFSEPQYKDFFSILIFHLLYVFKNEIHLHKYKVLVPQKKCFVYKYGLLGLQFLCRNTRISKREPPKKAFMQIKFIEHEISYHQLVL